MKQLVKIGLGVFLIIGLGSLTVFAAVESVSDEGIEGDIFGKKSGIIHPFLGVSGTYTDNLTNANENEESDYYTVIAPGVMLALPGTGATDVSMSSATGAPGGLALSRRALSTSRRFQGIAVYNPEIKMHNDNSDEDFTSQRVAGEFQYNAPVGLSIDIAAKHQYAQEMWNETPDSIDHAKYQDNVTSAIVDFALSPKFSLTAGGSYYTLAYKQDEFEYRDRDDRGFFGAVNFHIQPKTKLFCQYKRADLRYDNDASEDQDNAEDTLSVGVDWRITSKSFGRCSVGFVDKDYDDSAKDDESTWNGEVSLSHMFTTRTMVTATAVRGYYESNLASSDFYTTNRVSLGYTQAFTHKLFANMMLSYQNDDYDNVSVENDTWTFSPGIGFSPYRWLTCRLSWNHSDRDSDQDDWEYTTNEYILSLTASY